MLDELRERGHEVGKPRVARLMRESLWARIRRQFRREPPLGLVQHADRGCQYASREYRGLLDEHGVLRSIVAAGNCYDNAIPDSFFATLKKELLHGCAFRKRSEAHDAISNYIENYCNAKRGTQPLATNPRSTSSWRITLSSRMVINHLSGKSGKLHPIPPPRPGTPAP